MKAIKILFVIFFGFGINFNTRSQETFIYPDPTLVVLPGTFEININVDDDLVNFRGYRFVFSYDSDVMCFISAEKGPLMQGFSSYWWRVYNVSPDSLHIECMIFGAGLCVSGPGTVLKLTFQTAAEDTTLLEFKDHVFYDVDGGIIPGVIATDGTIIINYATLFTISGVINDSASASGIADVLVEFDNGGGSTYTNSQGSYSCQIISGWSGTATPSKTGYHFTPQNRSYSNVTNDYNNQDFTGALNKYLISGNLFNQTTGSPCSGVPVYFSNGIQSTICNSNGDYFNYVYHGWGGTITPCQTCLMFAPLNYTYSNVTENISNVDFTAVETNETFTVSGTITEASSGNGINNVLVTFSNNGGTTFTNFTGFYSHDICYGWSGNVVPSSDDYIFGPDMLNFFNVTSDHPNQNFAGIIAYHISGIITDPNSGYGIPDVVVEFDNNAGSTTTSSSGIYDHKVGTGWSGIATPSFNGYTFSPPSRNFNNVILDQPDQNYSGTADNLILTDTIHNGIIKHWCASNSITAPGTGGMFIIENGGSAEFVAGNIIYLKPGFRALAGCEFHAHIGNCSPVMQNNPLMTSTKEENVEINNKTSDNNIKIFPNPFTSKTYIEVDVPEDHLQLVLYIFDFTGKYIASKEIDNMLKGTYRFEFDGSPYVSGIYFYNCIVGKHNYTGKLILLSN